MHKIKIEFTEGDLQELQDGKKFDWVYTSDKGETISVELIKE